MANTEGRRNALRACLRRQRFGLVGLAAFSICCSLSEGVSRQTAHEEGVTSLTAQLCCPALRSCDRTPCKQYSARPLYLPLSASARNWTSAQTLPATTVPCPVSAAHLSGTSPLAFFGLRLTGRNITSRLLAQQPAARLFHVHSIALSDTCIHLSLTGQQP